MLAMTDGTTIQLGQAINKVVVITLDTIVHTEVDDFQILRHIMTIHKLLRVTMGGTEEQYIYLVQRKPVGKYQIGFTVKPFMYVGNLIAGVAATVYKLYLYFGMINQQTNQFACRITCPTDNSYFNHNQISSSLWLL